MDNESKESEWFGKIYHKLETLFMEVDSFTTQSTLCLRSSVPLKWDSVRDEQEEVTGDEDEHEHELLDLQSPRSPSDPPSHQNFNISQSFHVKERVQRDGLNKLSAMAMPVEEIFSGAPLLEGHFNSNPTTATTPTSDIYRVSDESQITNTLTTQKCSTGYPFSFPCKGEAEKVRVNSCSNIASAEPQFTRISLDDFGTAVAGNENPVLYPHLLSLGDPSLAQFKTEIPAVAVQDTAANKISTSSNSNTGNLGSVLNRTDVAPLATHALYRKAGRADPLYIDDKMLYAAHERTKKLRSFKKKMFDALTSRRRREKEYEQLAIWFGDAEMGSHVGIGGDFQHVESVDNKNSQVHESEDSEWELL